MQFKKNKFIIFYIFNIALLILILLFAIPFSKLLKEINLGDNSYVKDQVIINPEAKSSKILDRTINIKFIAKVDNSLNWEFKSLENDTSIRIGENKIIEYEGINLSDKTITSTAIFLATPESIAPYIIKTECFCFSEQILKPGEKKIFTAVFFIDPSIDSDDNFKDLKDLVFTYEFSEYKS